MGGNRQRGLRFGEFARRVPEGERGMKELTLGMFVTQVRMGQIKRRTTPRRIRLNRRTHHTFPLSSSLPTPNTHHFPREHFRSRKRPCDPNSYQRSTNLEWCYLENASSGQSEFVAGRDWAFAAGFEGTGLFT